MDKQATPRWDLDGWCNKHEGWHIQSPDGGTGIVVPEGNRREGELIVRAVNSFDVLVEAVKAARADLRQYQTTGMGTKPTGELMAQYDAALELAQGETK